jgi:hypothetical protein
LRPRAIDHRELMTERVVSHKWIDAIAETPTALPFQVLIAASGGWLQREQADVVVFLREENRILKVAGRRLRLDNGERRRLVEVGQKLGRHVLARVAAWSGIARNPRRRASMLSWDITRTIGPHGNLLSPDPTDATVIP